jgi:hypothetical protein
VSALLPDLAARVTEGRIFRGVARTGKVWGRLFEYDPLNQHLVTKQRVSDDALPAECPENVDSK